ncbi:MAG: hypothetical protein Q8L86_05030 [Vicinamibacterales bacterium]|nr:hypothetical protein [Vicinamibacterales bacterium]
MSGFMRHVLAMPMPWPAWVALLFVVNMAAVAFLPRLEAWVVLGGLGLGALLQVAIFARLGFVRLLGLGHVPWVAIVPWLWLRLDLAAEPALSRWMVAVVVLCGVSLAIDTVDVIRYLRGERQGA